MESLDFRLIIVQGIGFVLLYFLLKKFLFGRIIDLIKARENEIRDTYAKSDQDRDEASKLKSDYEARIAQAEEEAHKKRNDDDNNNNKRKRTPTAGSNGNKSL